MNYQRKYSFSGFQANNPARPLPAISLDAELDAISEAFEQTLDAFGVAKANGFQGNVVQWLASLKGEPGARGPQGDQGLRGLQGEKGDRGLQGAQGDPGHDGAKGDQGAQGAKGDAGPQGNAGPQGDRGLQGLQGAKGDTGAKGDQGPQGDQGPRGLQGLPGADGTNGIDGEDGAQGLQGPQGPKGDQGAGVTIKGTVASPVALPAGAQLGDTYIVSSSGDGYAAGDGYAYTGGGYTNVGQIRGPQGVQGVKGDTGTAGANGAAGAKGDQGLQGAKGDTGSAGAKGDTGAAGAKGDQGVQGAKGDTGAKGDQGIQGAKGDQGIQGIQGPKGDQGVQGAQGPQGPAGSLGYTPVQQGGGPGQLGNTVAIGFGKGKDAINNDLYALKGAVDGSDLGILWSDSALGGEVARRRVQNLGTGAHFCAPVTSAAGAVKAVGGAGFVRVGLNATESDAEGLFDVNNHYYNVLMSGAYLVTGSFRYTDGNGQFDFGFGVHNAEADGSHMVWTRRVTNGRFVSPYSRIAHYNKGDQVRMIFYSDAYSGSYDIDRATFQIALIYADT